MKITFVLPGAGRFPIGGLKVVYEYANRLARNGFKVTLVHTAGVGIKPRLREQYTTLVKFLKRKLVGDYGPGGWFPLDPAVDLVWVRYPRHRLVPDGDFVVATSWRTAEWVARYPTAKGKAFYLVQHKETWSGPEERVMATWKLPLKKIVISRWLQDIAKELGEAATYIPNGLDFNVFGMDQPPESRNSDTVMMMYHVDDWKGSTDGLEALVLVQDAIPSLEVLLFGVCEPRSDLPCWITYYRQPPQKVLRELYNKAAVFIAPSWSEGWGLPGSEAMMCGAALVATDIGGHREFAKAEQTALLAPARRPDALAAQVTRLCTDNDLRMRLAHAGHDYIQQFTWERSARLFEETLRSSA